MVLIYDKHSGDTIISENTYLSRNNVTEIRESVLSYLHVVGAKYRIQSSKTETDTNITIHKINERIESNKFLEDTDYDGAI